MYARTQGKEYVLATVNSHIRPPTPIVLPADPHATLKLVLDVERIPRFSPRAIFSKKFNAASAQQGGQADH